MVVPLTEFGKWTVDLLESRRGKMPEHFAALLDGYMADGEVRLVAGDLVDAAVLSKAVPSPTVEEARQALIYNERGWFGPKSKDYFRHLLTPFTIKSTPV